eukprot:Blabericola_migrator_1__9474@NODE_5140_length_863_cov_609_952261_g3266_i0_p1_GENE_NODE_5140_length_863_cov_609_952261_g3266_i0NODE_5140_length_863_cov_609_952261_g3266_i0_p1_ORF_typecomplete_len213_score27_65DUF4873/PF16170_5/8_2DUF4873/PF16170_5/7_NODE_5140_length_863_cov_609_952261_g3266_i0115753
MIASFVSIAALFLSGADAALSDAFELVTDGTSLDGCGGSCADVLGGDRNVATIIACITNLSQHSDCQITYGVPATLVVTGNCGEDANAVKVRISGVADWISGVAQGTIIAAEDVDEATSCVLDVIEGSDCDNTEVKGTLTSGPGTDTKVNLSGSEAVVKARTDECGARLTEQYLEGRSVIIATGGLGGSGAVSNVMKNGLVFVLSLCAWILV